MTPSMMRLSSLALGFAAAAQAASVYSPRTSISQACERSCSSTKYWPGWAGIKYAFIFGDSYTSTTFNDTGTQPSKGNPLGNPPYPGYTAANGPNWVDFLTVEYNASLLLTYNLAYGGATVDSDLVEPYLPTVLSVKEQVQDEFLPVYSKAPSYAPWKSANTLFAVWIGINDVGNSYYEGVPATTELNEEIFDVYASLVSQLYKTGARNFLFLNVPPVNRSPLTQSQGMPAAEEEAADIAAFNDKVVQLAAALKSNHSDSNVWTFDTNTLFNTVLDNPGSYEQTALYQNTTNYCEAYENGTAEEDTLDPSCYIPVNEYFWLNSLHPTYPMQNVVAEEVAASLKAGPNVC